MLPVPDVTTLDAAFGSRALEIMPAEKDIPSDFRDRKKWENFARAWFFRGLKKAEFIPKPGVDKAKALAAIKCVLGSFAPSHEHKEAAVAYMLSEWFEDVKFELGDLPI